MNVNWIYTKQDGDQWQAVVYRMTTFEFNIPTLDALGSSYFPEEHVQAEFRSNSELSVHVFKYIHIYIYIYIRQ
jgi:hypothetical protein